MKNKDRIENLIKLCELAHTILDTDLLNFTAKDKIMGFIINPDEQVDLLNQKTFLKLITLYISIKDKDSSDEFGVSTYKKVLNIITAQLKEDLKNEK